ncbi:TetR/AcrR family transcriptional regulator [Microbacterium allomyrinae]|uniref:TetR family transcriptional regulator n=1 Tax=Microbacterium allomyrinae TaxID=2830666 RepID=A0A9X1LT42_9MICO|nr:TetR family transcriptional regulator [Microbacterium allomyrinae]MCC2031248.1 TetR family transcriptional regulator [Microbacterium allomyrinae]
MANLRAKKKEETRRHLLDQALRLFEEQGYVATTIDDIATAVGTTRVTFYAHFPNKAEVMQALFRDLNERLERGESTEHRSTSRPLVDAVAVGTRDAIRPWLMAQVARWPAIRPYIIVVSEAGAVDPEIRELNDAWFGEVIADVTEGMTRAGRFDPETRHFRGYLAMELLHSTNLKWIRTPWPLDDSPELEVLVSAWTHLLGEPAAS